MVKLICLKCKKEIKPKDKYYKIILNDKGKELCFDVVHYSCWQDIFNPNVYLQNAMKLVQPMVSNIIGGKELFVEA